MHICVYIYNHYMNLDKPRRWVITHSGAAPAALTLAKDLIAANDVERCQHVAAPLAGQSFDLHQLCAIGWNAVGAQDLLDPDMLGIQQGRREI